MPTRKQIDNAIIISKCGSFTKASEQLYISSPALIQQINLLENEIGFDIFIRTKKGIQTTEAGHYYLNQMKHIHEKVDFIIETARSMAVVQKSTFRLSYLPGQSTKIAMELSHALFASFPNLSITLAPTIIKTAQEGLLSGKNDCCVMPILKENFPDLLDGFILSRSPLMIGIHPDLPLAQKEHISFSDFHSQRIVLPKRGKFETSDLFEDQLIDRGIPFERLTENDHVAAEMMSYTEKACRINGTAIEGSPLVYLPLKENIFFNMYLIFNKENYPFLKEYFEFIRTWSNKE